ncbi:MAG: ATPase, T2SS/T4P/T4SS family [Acidimicrobiales bacterium]
MAGIRARLAGLGPIEPLLADPQVTDVLVNGPGPVWVERSGRLEQTAVVLDRPAVDLLVERVVGPLGRRADPAHPFVDGRLADGSRVHVVVPPLAVDGPCVTIRRFGVRPVPLEQIAGPRFTSELIEAVRHRANVVVSGGTGSGKTTLLNALAAHLPAGERVVTVEDAAELRLGSDHVVRLEARPASEGLAEVPIRELVRNALRMRPDRLVIGEVRGGEAVDLLAAMNTGHDGSLSTVHANSAADALVRLEGLVLMAGVGVPVEAVRAQLRAAVDLVVHVARRPDGSRGVDHVLRVGERARRVA